ncbi:replication-relaxation family protein [Alkalihalophilus lindianensis]|uniref:Replication-relaxation family protein n=1 Tax=Alkalihalophilus lindianensis TaxID=1630542 RepID=A0ABU3X7H6_9BACI|nr:replication-relaxation family protein [Alkalihalophilus lindianensis]MDV2683780.1 replication-relaxation family protein [Alkalihalophilus lindianensis]MDV2683846.1 replication-relaxation family protein [Alkalihalophilus lindianensis]
MTRSQIQKLHHLGTDNNARRVMRNLNEWLCSRFIEEKVYYLNKRGREKIGSENIANWNPSVLHTVMRNDVYLYLKPSQWHIEQSIEVGNEGFKIVPDAIGVRRELDQERFFFVEIDNTQRWSENLNKLQKYRKLKEYKVWQEHHGYFPTIVWLTKSKLRANELKKITDLKMNVYEWEEIK